MEKWTPNDADNASYRASIISIMGSQFLVLGASGLPSALGRAFWFSRHARAEQKLTYGAHASSTILAWALTYRVPSGARLWRQP